MNIPKQKKQEKFELSITAESVKSTDERFTMDNLSLGNHYKPLNVYFKRGNGDILYSEAEGADDLKLWMNHGSTYEKNVKLCDDISVTKHGLKIPVDAEDYEGFVKRMKVSEEEFVKEFLG